MQNHPKKAIISSEFSTNFRVIYMPTRMLADAVASISEFKANPMKVMSFGAGSAVAVLNHNTPAFYCIPPALYEALMERLDDLELLAKVRERENEPSIKVTLDDL
jgi:antitoxin StbD